MIQASKMAQFFVLALVSFMLSACQVAQEITPEQPAQVITPEQLIKNNKEVRTLHRQLIKEESSTYAGYYLSKFSCDCQVFLFTETPEETLSRYTLNPRFSAKQARFSRQELGKAYDLTVQLVPNNSEFLRRNTHVEIDVSLNVVFLILNTTPGVSKSLAVLRPELHPAVSIIYDGTVRP